MKLRVIAALVAVMAFGVGSASAQSIGIYSDLGSANCNITALLYTPVNFYINVVGSGGLVPNGINGAEFQVLHTITGADAVMTPTPNAASNLNQGNPLAGGCNIAFPICQVGASVNLYSVQIVSFSALLANKVLSVDAHTTPSNVNFACALVNKCDAPAFTAVCVAGGQGFINGGGNCSVAVEDVTWSKVKNLFN